MVTYSTICNTIITILEGKVLYSATLIYQDHVLFCKIIYSNFLREMLFTSLQITGKHQTKKDIRRKAKHLYDYDLENIVIMTILQWRDDFQLNSLSRSLRG